MTAVVSVAEAIDTLNTKISLEVAKTSEESSGTQNQKEMSNNASRSSMSSQNTTEEAATTIVINPLLNEFVDCIENLPSRLQLLLSELRNIDAQVNIRHRKIQIVKQQILAKTIQAAATSLSAANSDGSTNSSSSSDAGGDIVSSKSSTITETKFTIEQLLNALHQILLQCQLLGDQKVKVTGQIMDILSTKTRKLGLDAKSNEERNFQVELDEEKIVNEFKTAIKKRSMHAKKNQLSNGVANNNSPQNSNRVSSRHVHTAHSLQTGSSKSKQQHLNSAEINKAVAKYTKSTNAVNNNNFKFLSNNRNPIDAYSFDEDQLSSMDTLNNRLKTSNKNHDSESDTKSLRSLNNLMNSTGNKKANLRNKYSEMKMNSGAKKSVKKLRDTSIQYGSSPKSKNSKNDNSPQSLNSRPKRHLNYTNNFDSKSSANKKRRLGQMKSNRLSLNLTNENSMTQCNSPSSSSTSSMNTGKLKSSHTLLNKSTAGSSKLIKSGDKVSGSGKDTRLRRKSDQLKDRSGNMKARMIKKNKKSGKVTYMQRRTNRSMENQDDADDDLSDEIDEYTATAFDSDNDNDEDDTDIENREFNQKAVHRGSDNEDMNSNETESINELDDMNDSDNEGMEEDEENEDEEGEGNDSNQSENENEDDKEEAGYRSNTGRKSKGFGKSYESYNEENSENDLTNASTGKAKANKRIKSLLYQQKKMASKSNAGNNNNNHGIEFPIESEPIYCVCSEISYGQMICCDNDLCKIEWFHFDCVKLNSKPKGKWYCPNCRGDSHKVMRKYANSETATSYSYTASYRIK